MQFSSIFLSSFFIAVALLPLSRPPYHAPLLLLACVLGIFFVNARSWWKESAVRNSSLVSTGVLVLVLIGTTPAFGDVVYWLDFLRLGAVILSIPIVVYLCGRYGKPLVATVFVGILLFQAQWGVTQFIVQHDLGLQLLGESDISVQHEAVAKFAAGGSKLLRAYGPYGHANGLAGMMVVGMVVLFSLGRKQLLSATTIFWLTAFTLLLLATLLTFSRMAYAGLLLLAVPNAGIFRVRAAHVSLISFIILISFLPLLSARFTDSEDQALPDRREGYYWWSKVMQDRPALFGFGIGKYSQVLRMYLNRADVPYSPWEIAPVHSVPLLLLAEWGVGGVILIAVFLAAMAWRLRMGRHVMRAVWWTVPLLPAIAFDHYFLTESAAMVGFLLLLVILLQSPPDSPVRVR